MFNLSSKTRFRLIWLSLLMASAFAGGLVCYLSVSPKSSSAAGASLSSQENAPSETSLAADPSSTEASSASDPAFGTRLTQPVASAASEAGNSSSPSGDNALSAASSSSSQNNASASTVETSGTYAAADRYHALASEQAQNPDVYAHLTIPGTKVDYPVLQNAEDDYYLSHNMDGSSGYPGCIYSNAVNSQNFSDAITVLYGHNMKNGSMFSALKKFKKKSFFNSHETFSVTTGAGVYTYEIYAALSYPEKYIPSIYNVKSGDGLVDFLNSINSYMDNAGSHVRAGMQVSDTDKICVLSTCVTGQEASRYLVIGKLVAVEN